MKTAPHARLFVLAAVVVGAALGGVAGCTDDNAIHENVQPDSGKQQGGDGGTTQGDGGTVVITGDSGIAVDCFSGDASTYEEIINACTPATKVDKHPVLPLLLADGGLPPLP